MQVCCGNAEMAGITEKIKATYPECHVEYVEGKIKTAGYAECLLTIFTLQYIIINKAKCAQN